MPAEASSPRKCRAESYRSSGRTGGYPQGLLLRLAVALSAFAAAVTLAAASHAAPSPGQQYVAPAGSGALFVISGHGYGHGVGLGQWGAQGYAKQGYTYDQVLAAYYPGTILGQTTSTSIRVLLASGKKKLTISSKKPITVEDGDGFDHTLAAGTTTITPNLELAVDGGPAQALDPPLTFSPAVSSTACFPAGVSAETPPYAWLRPSAYTSNGAPAFRLARA